MLSPIEADTPASLPSHLPGTTTYHNWRCRQDPNLRVKITMVWKKHIERPNVGGVSLLGVGTALRLERDAWSMVK